MTDASIARRSTPSTEETGGGILRKSRTHAPWTTHPSFPDCTQSGALSALHSEDYT